MDVLIVGGGGREHALAWKIAQSSSLGDLHAAPGNPGIASLGTCHAIRVDDAEALVGLCRRLGIDLVVVGPEAPLVAGLADELSDAGVAVFGPGAAAARIEGSKTFAKEILRAAGVPTAAALDEPRAPCVVKADGLAAGKGVFVCETEAELAAALPRARALSGHIVVEELLEGVEMSLFALCAGIDALPLAPAQDFKRLLDGDRGPNTGGMGSYSPVPWLEDGRAKALVEAVHRPVLRELAARGTPFQGLLYAGLMLTDEGPYVLEFNCRFGDPETQAILPRLEGDLLEALAAVARGSLAGVELDRGPGGGRNGRSRCGGLSGRSGAGRTDHRDRRGGGRRRARLPRWNRRPSRLAGNRGRARARRNGARRIGGRRTRAGVRRCRAHRPTRGPIPSRHRARSRPCHSLKKAHFPSR